MILTTTKSKKSSLIFILVGISLVSCGLSFIVKPSKSGVKIKSPQSQSEARFSTQLLKSSSNENSNMATATEVDDKALDHLLEVAMDASKKAGEIIIGNAGGAEITEKKANSRDLLTMIDPLCEKTIRETVSAAFPSQHEFLGEEDVPPGKEASAAALEAKLSEVGDKYLFICDPIDGTTNFVSGIPLSTVSLAVAYKGEIIVGVVYDPHRDEIFTAVKGRGAKMNGQTIKVGLQTTIGDAVVAMGSPPGEESMQMSMKGVQALMPKVRTIRMFGSAAIMLAWTASGRVTCYWEHDLSSWDVAAGALLVREAGGKFTTLSGEEWTLKNRKIMASNGQPGVHDEILRVLKEVGIE